jgi:putative ABC transport system ATP-binding protein
MLKFEQVTKIYTTDTIETTALDSINMHIEKGAFVAVQGPSGCGKSTLLNILGLMDTPTSGSLLIKGQDTSKLTERDRNKLRKQVIGFVFQKFNLIESLSIFENVELPLLYLRQPADSRRKAVLEVLERLDLAHRAQHFPHQLSGGQQQRAAVARCVVTNPELLLADEPTGNLDSQNGLQVMNILQELNAEGKTVVMVTHDDKYAAYATRIVHLFDGKLVGA